MSSVTVVVPMTIRRRGGRKQIFGPDGSPVQPVANAPATATTAGDPALVKALARAFRYQRLLDQGRFASVHELAAAEKLERGYVGSLLRLTLLAPDIVESVLDGHEPPDITLARLTAPFPLDWQAQREHLLGAGQVK